MQSFSSSRSQSHRPAFERGNDKPRSRDALPAHLGDVEEDQIDVTAPHGEPAYMNQSIFSLITAAAGSGTDFHAKLEDGDSSPADNNEITAKTVQGSPHSLQPERNEQSYLSGLQPCRTGLAAAPPDSRSLLSTLQHYGRSIGDEDRYPKGDSTAAIVSWQMKSADRAPTYTPSLGEGQAQPPLATIVDKDGVIPISATSLQKPSVADESEALAKKESRVLQAARVGQYDIQPPTRTSLSQSSSQTSSDTIPVAFDDPRASILDFRPTVPLNVCCLTIGSRGDVQPYIAFCKGLIAQGHNAKIATHREFREWIESYGIEFGPVDGDPAELMRICVENGMFTYSFLKEASSKFRDWIDDLLSSAWRTCQQTAGLKTDVLIESPSAMAGIHIAEALSIPYFRSFSMPWTRTRAYPHAFAVPEHKMGGAYNYFSYVMFDNLFWKATAGQINRWRRRELSLPSTNLNSLQPNKVPFLYSYSPTLVPPPPDYSDWIRVTGYWFLDEAINWRPPQELQDFISTARRDGKKLVYVGFGSIVVSDPAALTRTVIESVVKADVRCILSKGWSDRLGARAPSVSEVSEVPLPDQIYQIKSVPHDWLFCQIDAAAHHGGAGTTGASLRAGLPTIVKPFFGDQFFFGNRIDDLGVGVCVKKLNIGSFSRALWEACNSQSMRTRAEALGEAIRNEDGVGVAIEAMYRDLEYAKTLIQRKVKGRDPLGLEESEDDTESWTLVENDDDHEVQRHVQD